jgi:hypothetical protein
MATLDMSRRLFTAIANVEFIPEVSPGAVAETAGTNF